MKIISLQLSNILSFKYVQDVGFAERITFDDDLNIIIGENGSGKSTALEVINFVFRRVLYKQYQVNNDLYAARATLVQDQRRQIIQAVATSNYNGFRLDANWNTDNLPQIIRLVVKLDEIDLTNIALLQQHQQAVLPWTQRYSTRTAPHTTGVSEQYTLDIILDRNNQTFSVQHRDCAQDFGYEYLTEYNYFKEIISIYNLENPDTQLGTLYESFTLISSYRNYHAFSPSISLRDSHPTTQIRQIRSTDYNRSLNANDNSEPAIFGLVRLQVAEAHFNLIGTAKDEAACEAAANDLQFIKDINKRLRIINLKCKIKLIDLRSWQYSFEFLDLRRNRPIDNINSLSAGQKAITHLIFEAYGRGNLKGGVVIIDEPEIHLHYQFQHEYLEVIRELNKTQNCQYILVTHSEALINSTTIGSVRRFFLDSDGFTQIRVPTLSTDQKRLIRILDNTRSTYAFFAKKVILVEGDQDRYFFKALIQTMHPSLDQEIAVLHVGGKNELVIWSELFAKFGLIVFRIADLDYSYNIFYPSEAKQKLKEPVAVANFLAAHPDCIQRIEADYINRTFILKCGDLEQYLGISKNLANVIAFCTNDLTSYLLDDANAKSMEIRDIVRRIIA